MATDLTVTAGSLRFLAPACISGCSKLLMQALELLRLLRHELTSHLVAGGFANTPTTLSAQARIPSSSIPITAKTLNPASRTVAPQTCLRPDNTRMNPGRSAHFADPPRKRAFSSRAGARQRGRLGVKNWQGRAENTRDMIAGVRSTITTATC